MTRISPSPTRKTMASLGSVPGFPSRCTTPFGDEDEVARAALDALAVAGAELQSQAPLGLEHIGVVARVDVPAGPGAGFGSGPAGPDVVVGEGLAAVHPGRLGGGTVKGIRSDQGGSVHYGSAFRSGVRSSVWRQAMGGKVPGLSRKGARVGLTAVAAAVMGSCRRDIAPEARVLGTFHGHRLHAVNLSAGCRRRRDDRRARPPRAAATAADRLHTGRPSFGCALTRPVSNRPRANQGSQCLALRAAPQLDEWFRPRRLRGPPVVRIGSPWRTPDSPARSGRRSVGRSR